MTSLSATTMEFRRYQMFVGLVLWLVVLATLAGCERGGSPATRELDRQAVASAPAAREESKPETSDGELEANAEKSANDKEREVSCSLDVECSGYFRCIKQVCSVPPAITGEYDAQTPVVIFRAEQDRSSRELSRFYVELAISAQEQQRGLMFRRSMQPNWGMLFIYPYDDHHAFWMKNTLISLDMVFVNSAGQVVGVVEAAEPLTLSRREVDGASRYILELNAGVAAKSGIKEGVWMSFENIAQEHAPRF